MWWARVQAVMTFINSQKDTQWAVIVAMVYDALVKC